jgi:GLPGLI family protein
MTNKTTILLIFMLSLRFVVAQNYKATYRVAYCPDSTNLQNRRGENMLLFIKNNKESFFCSENLLKSDSILQLASTGKMSMHEIIKNPKNLFRTNFNYFIHKKYKEKKITFSEKIATDAFTFDMVNDLKWTIEAEQKTIIGYACTKATTTYAGRSYDAWFTTEISISDGPYIFSGLPGLIVAIEDTRKHYVFMLKEFQAYKGTIVEKMQSEKPTIPTTKAKLFALRAQIKKDPIGAIENATGHKISGADGLPFLMMPINTRDNPLEIK